MGQELGGSSKIAWQGLNDGSSRPAKHPPGGDRDIPLAFDLLYHCAVGRHCPLRSREGPTALGRHEGPDGAFAAEVPDRQRHAGSRDDAATWQSARRARTADAERAGAVACEGLSQHPLPVPAGSRLSPLRQLLPGIPSAPGTRGDRGLPPGARRQSVPCGGPRHVRVGGGEHAVDGVQGDRALPRRRTHRDRAHRQHDHGTGAGLPRIASNAW
jgi:hypothetical protein